MNNFRDTKIENLCVSTFGYENVGWFDVPVNDTFGVGGFEGVGDFYSKSKEHLGIKWFACDTIRERQAVQEFHHNECLVTFLPDVVDGANIRMIQGGSSLRFTPKTR